MSKRFKFKGKIDTALTFNTTNYSRRDKFRAAGKV
jgi:hypothetical protein